jgi:hypothetical protein
VSGGAVSAGDYTASAVSLNSDYYIINSSVRFVISKAENSFDGTPSIKDAFFGREPSLTGCALYGETYLVYYKDKDGINEITPPFSVGTYYARAASDGDENHLPISSELMEFSIIDIIPTEIKAFSNQESFTALSRINECDISVTLVNNDNSTEIIPFADLIILYENG